MHRIKHITARVDRIKTGDIQLDEAPIKDYYLEDVQYLLGVINILKSDISKTSREYLEYVSTTTKNNESLINK